MIARNTHFYNSIKTALESLKEFDHSLKILDTFDQNIDTFVTVEIDSERFDYDSNEYLEGTCSFDIFLRFKTTTSNNVALNTKLLLHKWIDEIESSISTLSTDSCITKNGTVQIIGIKIIDNTQLSDTGDGEGMLKVGCELTFMIN